MENLGVRALSGSVYVVAIFAGIFLPPWGVVILAAVLGSIAWLEWQFFRPEKPSQSLASHGISILLIALFLFSNVPEVNPLTRFLLLGAGTILFISLLLQLAFRKNTEDPMGRLGHTIFGLVYLIPALVFLTLLGKEPWLLASIFIMIWSFDSFAYLSGRFLGKHKLMPSISPNKTWEGFIGGSLFVLLASYLQFTYLPEINLSLWQWLVLGMLVIASSTLGDLFESALKRMHDLKDSGNFMPGHGGILDRIDSLLFAMPVSYLFLNFIAAV